MSTKAYLYKNYKYEKRNVIIIIIRNLINLQRMNHLILMLIDNQINWKKIKTNYSWWFIVFISSLIRVFSLIILNLLISVELTLQKLMVMPREFN